QKTCPFYLPKIYPSKSIFCAAMFDANLSIETIMGIIDLNDAELTHHLEAAFGQKGVYSGEGMHFNQFFFFHLGPIFGYSQVERSSTPESRNTRAPLRIYASFWVETIKVSFA